MTKNLAFKSALEDPQLAEQPDIIPALNRILQAIHFSSPNDGNFRDAVIHHYQVWNGLGKTDRFDVSLNEANDDNFLRRDGALGAWSWAKPSCNYEALAKLAAEKRVLLTLKNADEAQLESLFDPANTLNEVRKKLFGDDGKSTFGAPEVIIQPVTAPSGKWNPTNQDILDDAAIGRIQAEAKRQLLIKKITDSNDRNAVNNLLISADDLAFSQAARAVFGLPLRDAPEAAAHYTDNMRYADRIGAIRADEIKDAAAKKVVSLDIQTMPNAEVIGALPYLTGTTDYFKNNSLSTAAQSLADRDVDELKGQLGARYLIATYSSRGDSRLADLEKIAGAINDVALQTLIRTSLPENGVYINKAVTPETLTSIRQAAAKQALKLKIAQCDDEDTLNELISITNNNELKQKLAAQQVLGYSTNNNFREAFSESDVTDIIAVAHIQKHIITVPTDSEAKKNHLDKLKELILEPNFSAKYIHEFTSDATPNSVKTAIEKYFQNDETKVDETRGQALVTCLQPNLSNPAVFDDAALTRLVTAGNYQAICTEVNTLLDFQPGDIRRLHAMVDSHDSGIGLQVCRYAAVEQEIRNSKNLDLTGQAHGNFLNKINTDAGLNALITTPPELPAKEMQHLKAGLVESLIRNLPVGHIPAPVAPSTDNGLIILAKAADIDQFKTALTAIGVTEQGWVSATTMEQMQKAACTQFIKLDQGNHLAFGGEARPQLIKVINKLSLAQQRALLEKPKALVALSGAKQERDVHRILGGKFVEDSLVNALVKENTYLAAMASIPNSALAKVLMNIQPALDEAQIKQVTDYVLGLNQNNFDAGAEYKDRVKHIARNIMGLDKPATNAIKVAFGIVENADDQIRQAIHNQHTYNEHVLARYNRVPAAGRFITETTKAIYAAIATLNKTQQLSDDEALQLHAALSETTYKDFTKRLKQAPVNNFANLFDPPLEKQITPKRFSEIKIAGSKRTLLQPKRYKGELGRLEKELTKQTTEFDKTKLGYFATSSLKRLATAKPMYWLNPAFQGASKESAKKMGREFRELSDNCDIMVTHLRERLNQAQELLDSLPSNEDIGKIPLNPLVVTEDKQNEMKKAINNRRKEITALQDNIKKELDEYEKLQIIFKGNPNASEEDHLVIRQGILKTLKQAEEGKTDIKFTGFKSYHKDYPIAKRAEHFAAGWQGEGAPKADEKALRLRSSGSTESFETIGKVESGMFREYTVYCKTGTDRRDDDIIEKSTYIEERGATDLAGRVDSKGATLYVPEIRLTANKFPHHAEARVQQSMEMAIRILAALGKPPTPNHPIIIDRGTKVEVQYAWTALMAIGKNDPNMRFDEKSIIVDNAQFDPDKELGTNWGLGKGFAKDSLFTRQFKKSESFSGRLKTIKKIDSLRFDPSSKAAVENDTSRLTQFYKSINAELTTGVEKKGDTIPPSAAP